MLTDPYLVSTGIIMCVICFFVIRQKRKLRNALLRIEETAVMDELTELHNQRYFFARLQDECNRSRRYFYSLSCILLNIDHFEKINEAYGRKAGNAVLQSISDILKTNSRNADVAARYSGEEFITLLPETNLEEALMIAERMRGLIASRNIVLNKKTVITVTASFGVSTISATEWSDAVDFREILKKAVDSLEKAKKNGRNRVESYSVVAQKRSELISAG